MQLGNRAKAEEWLARSAQLLPTAPAAFYLGQIGAREGQHPQGTRVLQGGWPGRTAPSASRRRPEFVKIDLPQNPGNYVAAAAQIDARAS